jgi:hypothetical protein
MELMLDVPIAVHRDGMSRFGARVTPFAFLIASTGEIVAKGLVNTTQGLDLLIQPTHRSNGHPREATGIVVEDRVGSGGR